MNHQFFIDKVQSLHKGICAPWVAEGSSEAPGVIGIEWRFQDKELAITFLPEGKVELWCSGLNFEREDLMDDTIANLNLIIDWFVFGEKF